MSIITPIQRYLPHELHTRIHAVKLHVRNMKSLSFDDDTRFPNLLSFAGTSATTVRPVALWIVLTAPIRLIPIRIPRRKSSGSEILSGVRLTYPVLNSGGSCTVKRATTAIPAPCAVSSYALACVPEKLPARRKSMPLCPMILPPPWASNGSWMSNTSRLPAMPVRTGRNSTNIR